MLCKNPFMKGIQPCGCGQCMPCRINKSREWSNRLMLESRAHKTATFITLTYRDEELHDVSNDWNGSRPLVPNLVPLHPQNWLKRIRKVVPTPLRFFLVGEYGDQTQRPHYHVALFGFPNCVYGRIRPGLKICCGPCDLVKKTWGFGNIQLGELNKDTAQYIAGYVTKKWTREDSWTKEKLKGRHPEFPRMSLKPGIGATAIKRLINFTEPTRSGQYVRGSIDAPVVLRNSGSTLPLGRYLKRKWREALGRSPDTPKSVSDQYLSELYKENCAATLDAQKQGVPSVFRDAKANYYRKTKQKIKNLDARAKIHSTRRHL